MAKTKQNSVVFHPDEMAGFGRQPPHEKEITLFELENRVKNLENSIRTLLEQITDISIQMDTLQKQQQKAAQTQRLKPKPKSTQKNKPTEPSPDVLKMWSDKIYTFLEESGDKHTTTEIKQAVAFDEHKQTFRAVMKQLQEQKRVESELDETSKIKSWWI